MYHSLTDADLDLIYFEPSVGGHSGIVGAFYSPEVYDWMFAHTLPVPEPASAAPVTALRSSSHTAAGLPHYASRRSRLSVRLSYKA